MDFHGDINLRDNEIQKLVFQQESSFPASAVVGSVVFNDKKLYMCVALNVADPIWIPLTNSIDTYIHDQDVAATTWTVVHNIGQSYQLVQVYDSNNEMIIPESVSPSGTHSTIITFNTAITGRAIIMFGDVTPANGIGVIEPIPTNFNATTGVLNQNSNLQIFGYGITFSPDGMKMYTARHQNGSRGNYEQYDLGTAWTINTATFIGNFNVFSIIDDGVYDFQLSDDGLKVIYGDDESPYYLRVGNLSVAYDMTTAVDSGATSVGTAVPFGSGNYGAFHFSPDGTRLYFAADPGGEQIRQFSLPTPWDITDIDAVAGFSTGGQYSSPSGLHIDETGKHLYVMNRNPRMAYYYQFGTLWDVTTLSFIRAIDLTFLPTDPRGVFVDPGGLYMFTVTDSNGLVRRILLS